MRDEDGNIADDLDLALVGVKFERTPLFEVEKLLELSRLDLFMEVFACGF